MEAMRLRFDRALAGMWTAFQPIVSWSRKAVVAYEALMRTTDTELSSPMEILRPRGAQRMSTLGRKTRGLVADVLRNTGAAGRLRQSARARLGDEDLYSPHAPLSEFCLAHSSRDHRAHGTGENPRHRERVAHLRRLGFASPSMIWVRATRG